MTLFGLLTRCSSEQKTVHQVSRGNIRGLCEKDSVHLILEAAMLEKTCLGSFPAFSSSGRWTWDDGRQYRYRGYSSGGRETLLLHRFPLAGFSNREGVSCGGSFQINAV